MNEHDERARRRRASGRARLGRGRPARPPGHIPLGYYKDEEKTAATFLVDPDGERWVIPGDFATVDADGTLNLLGRGSVCINTGGEKVYPEEVEAALKAHPDVFDAVVVGVPDDRFGERVAAIVHAARRRDRRRSTSCRSICRDEARRLQGAAPAARHRRDPAHPGRQARLPLGQEHRHRGGVHDAA